MLIDEVVVVGYGTVRKSDLTGSVGKVTTSELNQLSTTDIGQAIAGRVAGVDVTSNSGAPGAGTKIRVRGYGTINSSDPLYVVDGFPVSDIDYLSPQDIESLEILKDASATAIYGSRGANGVVLIKPKEDSIIQRQASTPPPILVWPNDQAYGFTKCLGICYTKERACCQQQYTAKCPR